MPRPISELVTSVMVGRVGSGCDGFTGHHERRGRDSTGEARSVVRCRNPRFGHGHWRRVGRYVAAHPRGPLGSRVAPGRACVLVLDRNGCRAVSRAASLTTPVDHAEAGGLLPVIRMYDLPVA